MSDKGKSGAPDLFEQALKNYEQALKTGVRLQEESSKWWTNVLGQTKVGSPQDWQKQANATVDATIATLRKQVEESLKSVEDSSKTSLDLLEKAIEASRSSTVPEAQGKLQELYQTSLNALQHNLQAMTKAQAKMMESWTDYVRKGAPEPAGRGR
jgi:uncharacterized protein YukE